MPCRRYRDPAYQVSRVTALEQAQNENDVDAQLYCAFRAFNTGDIQQSILWYRRAATQGSSQEAMLNLAKLYECGPGGAPVDISEACRWMKLALETTEFDENDIGIQRDLMHSYGWYLLGAKTPGGMREQQQLPPALRDVK